MSGFDREKARDLLAGLGYGDAAMFDVEGILDAFETCFTPQLGEVRVRLISEAELRLNRIRAQVDKVADTKFPYLTVEWLRNVLDASIPGGAS